MDELNNNGIKSVNSLTNELISNILKHSFPQHSQLLHHKLKRKFFQVILDFPPFPHESNDFEDVSNEEREITLSKQLGSFTYFLRTHNRIERANNLENVANLLIGDESKQPILSVLFQLSNLEKLFSHEEQETKMVEDLFQRFNLLPKHVDYDLSNVQSASIDLLSDHFDKIPRDLPMATNDEPIPQENKTSNELFGAINAGLHYLTHLPDLPKDPNEITLVPFLPLKYSVGVTDDIFDKIPGESIIPSIQEPVASMSPILKRSDSFTPRSEKNGRLSSSFSSNKETENSLETSNWDESFDYSRDEGFIEVESVQKEIISWDKLLHIPKSKKFKIEMKKEKEKLPFDSKSSYGWENISSHSNFEAAYEKYCNHLFTPKFSLISEKYAIKHVLSMLQGIESPSFTFDEISCSFQANSVRVENFSLSGIKELFNDLSIIGSHLRRLEIIVNEYGYDGSKRGVICQAFASGIEDNIRYHRASLLNLFQEDNCSLLEIQRNSRSLGQNLLYLAEICGCQYDPSKKETLPKGTKRDQILDKIPRSSALISHLYKYAMEERSPIIMQLFKKTIVPYFNFIQKWISDGVIDDYFSEFFVQFKEIKTEDESYWLNSFKDRGLEHLPSFLHSIHSKLFDSGRCYNLLKLLNGNREFLDPVSFDKFFASLVEEHISAPVPISEGILLSFINHSELDFIMDSAPRSLYLDSLDKIAPKDSQSTLLPLQLIIEREVIQPVSKQHLAVNKSLLYHFILDLKCIEHLSALRNYLLMNAGDFIDNLATGLFEKLKNAITPNVFELNSVLENALKASGHDTDPYSNLLSFAVTNPTVSFNMSNIEALDFLQLQYDIVWPLNIIVTKSSLVKYNQIFGFLLRLKRVAFSLKETWKYFKEMKFVRLPQASQLQLFRHEMQHFVDILQQYVINQIHEIGWKEFEEKLSTEVHTLEDLIRVHDEYLNTSINRCLLNSGSVMRIIVNIFEIILRFHSYLYTQSTYEAVTKIKETYTNMKEHYQTFRKHTNFLFIVLAKLTSKGYESHFSSFLMKWNYNNFYAENVSKASFF